MFPGSNDMRIFTGNANPTLAEEISRYLKVPLAQATIRRFSDGEMFVEVGENVRGRDVFVIQPTCPPVNDNLMELLIIMDALMRASAHRITAVVPYYGYARQDRKVAPRVPISAKLVAELITTAGADRLLTMDLHAGQIQGFFNVPVDNLYASGVLAEYIRENVLNEVVVVSPDAGGVERALGFASKLNSSLAIIDKRRDAPNQARAMNIIGEVEGKTAVILDDMIDTAGTITQAAEALLNHGAKAVHACATHPVLSGPAITRLTESKLQSVVVTNTIPLSEAARDCQKIVSLSVAWVLGEAIRRIHREDSVSELFG